MKFASVSTQWLGAAFGISLALLGNAAIAQTAKKPPLKKAKASIAFTLAPKAGPGETSFGDIGGTVKNAPKDSKVVLYSLGDTWYVQPYANAPFTAIGKDGKFSANIHGGHEFAALLVKPGYQPPATISDLPKVGVKILATTRAKRAE